MGASAHHVEQAIAGTQQRAIENVRQDARNSSARFWTKWTGLAAVGVGLAIRSNDAERARQSADSLAHAWRTAFLKQEGASLEDAADAANEAIRSNVARTAATETYQAWDSETARQGRYASAHGSIVKETWSAMLDACPRCWDLDGESRVWPDTFAERPPLHPWCACKIDSTVEDS